ncbi:serine hydrolase [Arthrobacter oryzae]|uniref:serine hydrolase domain-containing protein n=1 Tax=Arthrobacter oryzae TaxID=409290 RepID=UPI002858D3A6|nr:serine hydrolase [Arthrobacter oryzae]MDR6506107.1 D-alanyl-D-alanine carboxypeptidase [Arthrobacter oryzae]
MGAVHERGWLFRAAAAVLAVASGMMFGGCTVVPGPDPSEPALPTSTSPRSTSPTPPASTPATAPPSAIPTSTADRLPPIPAVELKAQLEQYSQRLINAGAPAVLLELRVGAEVWTHAAGVRNSAGEAARLTDPVHVGDITQPLVAVSVLKLAEEGRLSLDEPASTYLPELDSLLHQPEPYTVRRLLGHTSGMPDYYAALLASVAPRQALATRLSPTDKLALAAMLPWERRRAQTFSYSNSNYIALGLIVERLRGRPLADVLRADVGQPLGLDGTRMTADGPVPEDMVHGYARIDGEAVDATYAAVHIGSAATGLVSTVSDLNAFFDALLDGRLVRRERVAEMQGPVHAEYGLGLFQWNDRCTNGFYYGYVGDVPGYGTVAMASADGSRRLALAVAYPQRPFPEDPAVQGANGILAGMTQLAEDTLNGSCRLGGDVWFGQGP